MFGTSGSPNKLVRFINIAAVEVNRWLRNTCESVRASCCNGGPLVNFASRSVINDAHGRREPTVVHEFYIRSCCKLTMSILEEWEFVFWDNELRQGFTTKATIYPCWYWNRLFSVDGLKSLIERKNKKAMNERQLGHRWGAWQATTKRCLTLTASSRR